jgi:hypothetical protein
MQLNVSKYEKYRKLIAEPKEPIRIVNGKP